MDPAMLTVDNLSYDSWTTICFQRASVIASDLVLIFALYRYVKISAKVNVQASQAAAISVLLSPGLLIIDHIHFQYNGFLYGILIYSITFAKSQSTMLYSGIFFAILLCLKHIYLYLAPAFFIYLLRAYCLDPESVFRPRFLNAVKLGTSIIAILFAAFGPILWTNQLGQLMNRLFPFSRGLCHAYWAPNFWALYSFADRIIIPCMPNP